MITFKLTISIFLLHAFSFFQNSPNDFQGNWVTTEMDNTSINIYLAKDGYWYGKIIKSDSKEHVGKFLLKKLKYDITKKVLTGELQRPGNGMKVNATLSVNSDGTLKVVGKKLLLSKTVYFSKLN